MAKLLLRVLLVFAALVATAPAFAAQSPFFLDTRNQLWAATDTTGKTYLFTGTSGVQLSVGVVSPGGGGGEIAAVRRSDNRVAIFNGNNNVVTLVGISAVDIAAGRGKVYVRRPDNTIAVLTLGALNPNGTFNVTVIPTSARALQMSVGFDFTTGADFLAFRDSERVRFMEIVSGVPRFGASGLSAIDIVAGNQKETFIRRPDNRIAVLVINAATASGITLLAPIMSTRQAVQMSVSRNNPTGNDYMAFRAPDNSVNFANFSSAGPSISFFPVPGAAAKQVVAGVTEIFIRRPTDRVQYYTLNGAGTGISSSTLTSHFATLLRDTRFTAGPGVIDQVAMLKGQQLFVSQNNGAATAIASFFNTGFFAKNVLGYAKFP
jgi:hypothetical protein